MRAFRSAGVPVGALKVEVVDGDEEAVELDAEEEEEDDGLVAHAFVPSSVEMVVVPAVPLTMVIARPQIIVVGLDEAPYRLVTAVSRFVWPKG